MGAKLYRSVEEHALMREQAWYAAHPDQKADYGSRDMVWEAAEELADAYNYILHLPMSRHRAYLLDYLRNAYVLLRTVASRE